MGAMRIAWVLPAIALFAACNKSTGLNSMGEAVEFARSRGLLIESSTDSAGTGEAIVQAKTCKVRGKKATLYIYQFVSDSTVKSYQAAHEKDPKRKSVANGRILFVAEGETEAERQEILVILK
jgi:hypothetical protein